MIHWTVREALIEIVTRAPSISREAIKTLSVPEERVPRRFSLVAEHALRDPEADWTQDERRAIIALIEDSGDEGRSERIYVRLTPREKADVEMHADSEGVSLSEFIRRRIVAG